MNFADNIADALLFDLSCNTRSMIMLRDGINWIVSFEDGTIEHWPMTIAEMLAQPIDSYEPFADTTVLDEDILIDFWDKITKRRTSL